MMKLKLSNEKLILYFSVLILVLSLIPRFYDILKFLPNYSIDENDIVEFAVGYWGGDLDPHWYKYGPLYSYILSAVYYVVSLFHHGGTDAFAQDIFFDSTWFYYIARFINSCVNIILAVFTFKLARKYFSSKVAWLAFLIAVFPFFDLLVNFTIRIDTLLALWSLLALYNILQIQTTGKTKYYILSAVFVGLGLATKPIPSLLILPTFFLGHFWGHQNSSNQDNLSRQEIRQLKKAGKYKTEKQETKRNLIQKVLHAILNKKLLIFACFAGLSGFVFNPYSVLNFDKYFNEQKQAVLTEGGRNFTAGWDVTRFFSNLGIVFVLLGIISVLYLLYKAYRSKNKTYIVFISYPIIFWLAFAKGAARDYFYVPMIPSIIIAIAFTIDEFTEKLKVRSKLKNLIPVAIVLLIMLIPFSKLVGRTYSLNSHGNYREAFTEIAAKNWIEKNIPQDKRILMYGNFTSLPRIVSTDINDYAKFSKENKKRAFLGQFFMYGRMSNKYFAKKFVEAHKKYIEDAKPAYTQLDYLRAGQKNLDANLVSYIYSQKVEYIISELDFNNFQYFKDHSLKMFNKEEGYPLGRDIGIYKISLKDTSDLVANPVSENDYFLNGFLNMQLQRSEEAFFDLSKCIDMGVENANAYFFRGIIHSQQNEQSEALADYEKTIEINPKFANAHYNKGITHLKLNERELACESFHVADSLGYRQAKTMVDRFCK